MGIDRVKVTEGVVNLPPFPPRRALGCVLRQELEGMSLFFYAPADPDSAPPRVDGELEVIASLWLPQNEYLRLVAMLSHIGHS